MKPDGATCTTDGSPACWDVRESDCPTETKNLHGGRLSFSLEDTAAERLLVSAIPQSPISLFRILISVTDSFFNGNHYFSGIQKINPIFLTTFNTLSVQSKQLFCSSKNTQLKSIHCICMQLLRQIHLHYGASFLMVIIYLTLFLCAATPSYMSLSPSSSLGATTKNDQDFDSE